jgi:hypothetical protein
LEASHFLRPALRTESSSLLGDKVSREEGEGGAVSITLCGAQRFLNSSQFHQLERQLHYI